MTKRDRQLSEYATESYEKPPTKRGVSHTDGVLTAEERDAIRFFAAYGGPAHRANTLRKLFERTSDEPQDITQESQNGDTLPAYGVWRDRSEQPPMDKAVLLYTRQLEGYMWVGRRGLLPNDVTHWCQLPEPPNVK